MIKPISFFAGLLFLFVFNVVLEDHTLLHAASYSETSTETPASTPTPTPTPTPEPTPTPNRIIPYFSNITDEILNQHNIESRTFCLDPNSDQSFLFYGHRGIYALPYSQSVAEGYQYAYFRDSNDVDTISRPRIIATQNGILFAWYCGRLHKINKDRTDEIILDLRDSIWVNSFEKISDFYEVKEGDSIGAASPGTIIGLINLSDTDYYSYWIYLLGIDGTTTPAALTNLTMQKFHGRGFSMTIGPNHQLYLLVFEPETRESVIYRLEINNTFTEVFRSNCGIPKVLRYIPKDNAFYLLAYNYLENKQTNTLYQINPGNGIPQKILSDPISCPEYLDKLEPWEIPMQVKGDSLYIMRLVDSDIFNYAIDRITIEGTIPTPDTGTQKPFPTAIPASTQPTPVPRILYFPNIADEIISRHNVNSNAFDVDPNTNRLFLFSENYYKNICVIPYPQKVSADYTTPNQYTFFRDYDRSSEFGVIVQPRIIAARNGIIYVWYCGMLHRINPDRTDERILNICNSMLGDIYNTWDDSLTRINNFYNAIRDFYEVKEGDAIPATNPGTIIGLINNLSTNENFNWVTLLGIDGMATPATISLLTTQKLHGEGRSMVIGNDQHLYILVYENDTKESVIYRLEINNTFIEVFRGSCGYPLVLRYIPKDSAFYLLANQSEGNRENTLYQINPDNGLPQKILSDPITYPTDMSKYFISTLPMQAKDDSLYILRMLDNSQQYTIDKITVQGTIPSPETGIPKPFPTEIPANALPTPDPAYHESPKNVTTELTQGKITVSWDLAKSSHYRIHVYLNSNKIIDEWLDGQQYTYSFEVTAHGDGVYQFFVRGENQQKEYSPWTKGKIIDTLAQDKGIAVSPSAVSVNLTGDHFEINWMPVATTDHYRIHIYKDGIYQSQTLIPGNQSQCTIPASMYGNGVYQFYLRGENRIFETDKWVASNQIDLDNEEYSTPLCPNSLHCTNDGKTVKVQWNAVTTHHYRIDAYRSGSFVQSILLPGNQTDWEIPDNLIGPKEYYFYIRGENEASQATEWLESNHLFMWP